ncbi:MAG TPA: ABC transporter permease subunit, partial [Saprospiraceae bacterium]|nr:ABC transporter permease subunit [Saprospiraceae bacterium]
EKYVEAVRSMGMSTARILRKHILPNMLGPLFVIAVSNFASAIIVESGLSYLGFGIQPPTPSLGSILSENYGFILSNKPILAIAPVVVLLLLVLAFNLVGNGVRDIFDVKSNSQT